MQLVKTTKQLKTQSKRTYDDACGTAHGLELIGERWAMLVLRELMLGPRRFSGLKADLPGISANVLTQRLSELEQRGLVRQRRLPPPANFNVYEATDWGLEAEPILQQLGRWATRSPGHNPGLPLSAVSIMLSFRTMLDAERAKGLSGTFGFRLGAHHYLGRLEGGTFTVERGETDAADVVFTCTPTELAAVVYGGAPLDSIGIEGDKALAARFVTLFPLPPKVG
jgi:DNA-binding HxlR family transcriptional regulator